MKTKILLTLLFVVIVQFCYGQEYHKLVDTNKLWSTLIVEYIGPPTFDSTLKTQHIRFGDDTIINGLIYKKVLETYNENLINWSYSGYIREDSSRKVYYLNYECYDEEYLIYDFNVNIGDTINYFEPYIVDSIDSIYISTHYRKRIFIHSIISSFSDVWIEGIGSIYGVINSMTEGVVGIRFELLCFFENDTLCYQNSNYNDCYIVTNNYEILQYGKQSFNIYPNPINKCFIIDTEILNNNSIFEIYNSLGQLKYTYLIISRKTQICFDTPLPQCLYTYIIRNNDKIIQTGKIIIE